MRIDEASLPPPLPRRVAFRSLLKVHRLQTTGAEPRLVSESRAAAQAARSAQKTVEAALTSARRSMLAEGSRLQAARSEGVAEPQEPVAGRVLELILRELKSELPAEPRKTVRADAVAAADGAGHARTSPPLPSRAQAVLDLIDHIDLLVRSHRPTLVFSMNSAFAARVEVEKTGPNEVALKIQGWRGPPPPEEISRIRDTLRARGLRLSSLSVG
jgi:hypothetical protein